jgi:hypothetical protein
VLLAQAPDAKNEFFIVILRRFQIRDERDLTVVIIEANALQPFVRDALRQIQRGKITVANTFFGQRLVKLHHLRGDTRALTRWSRSPLYKDIGSNREQRATVSSDGSAILSRLAKASRSN